jgi:uncharacterized membrane protein YeaQ/YmgE (transglycosylase-associated protein family)
MGIIVTIIVGLIVGAIARFLLPGEQKMGWIMTCLLGIAGSLIAGYAGQALGWYAPGQPAGWIASIVGAVVLLIAVGMLRKR